jgi:hypothetical protein
MLTLIFVKCVVTIKVSSGIDKIANSCRFWKVKIKFWFPKHRPKGTY